MAARVRADFAAPASEAELASLAERLRERNLEVVIVKNGDEARAEVLKRIPDGASIHSGKSKTLEDAGIFSALMDDERYDFIRRKTLQMDRRTQMREITRMGATPDLMINSAQALTEDGQLVITSATGSQLAPLASGAAKVIFVIGSQKIVPDLDTAFRRIKEYVFPYEDARLREQLGAGTKIAKTLIFDQEYLPGRTTVILVREPIGV
jgi:L-lactate utilization protein LutC